MWKDGKGRETLVAIPNPSPNPNSNPNPNPNWRTETLLAVMAGLFIYAGNISRGTASLVLQMGCPPLLMPVLIGLVACPIACGLLVAVRGSVPCAAPGPQIMKNES